MVYKDTLSNYIDISFSLDLLPSKIDFLKDRDLINIYIYIYWYIFYLINLKKNKRYWKPLSENMKLS